MKAAVWTLVSLGALAAVMPAGALAQRCQAPPGNSAIEQYCETLPGPAGDRHAGSTGGRGGTDLPPRVVAELMQAGPDGAALLRVTGAQRAPRGADGSGSELSTPDESREEPASDVSDGGGDPVSALKAAADSGPSTGPVFLWVLVGLAALLAAVAWLRSRFQRG